MGNQEIQEEMITVLGKTFSSEEERRKYFREELRKKLPELKKMEGFPIGEDEDILNLSDPPYYTACPNPWINDFIEIWEEEKRTMEQQGKREANFEVDEPYAADVSEGKNNPIYMAHSYHTKVPHPAIMRYILHYTQPGDIVYDSFAGTGMTGVAASMCEDQTLINKLKIQTENTGKRNAICNDLSSVASFIAYNYNNSNSYDRIESIIDQLEDLQKELNWAYKTKHRNTEQYGEINFVIWSEIFMCNNCGDEINYWDVAVNKTHIQETIVCSSCQSNFKKRELSPAYETLYLPEFSSPRKHLKLTPVLINYSFNNKRYEKTPDSTDFEILNKINQELLDEFANDNIKNGDEIGRLSKHGFENIREIYFRRSRWILEKLQKELNHNFSFLLTSVSQNSSKLYRYRLNGKGGTTSGTYYICSTPQENNVFNSIKNKLKNIKKALHTVKNDQVISTGSATNLDFKENSIDYIFTDPPFGSNLMYSELNLIMETWLKVLSNPKMEAVSNKSQNKNLLDYQNIMTTCFQNYYRVLKPGKWMTVEFSNTSAAIWNGIQTAITNSGFIISNVSGLDRKQGSFKTMTTATAVKQDLVISCYKPSSKFDEKFKQHQSQPVAVWDFVEEHLNHLPIHLVKDNATTAIIERSPKILFDRLIAFYVQKNLPVPIDAGKFQLGLRERFAERDGMFFTQEQVQQYDKKKAEVPDFVQLSILVSSEQDGVLWLKNLLQEKEQTYQDLHPQWMQALAGVRKGDIIPELGDILEENFLKNDKGKWYVPDPENEADLEKLRNKRLLRQFEEYNKEALKPKGKIKEARVEALRAGFKQSYQDKDFKTIVTVGDKIPNQLLMEDEVLLQFYDIASSRV